MSIGGYFVTEDEEKLKRYDTRQRGLELKKHLATLKSELNDYSAAWARLGKTFDNADHYTFTIDTKLDAVRVDYPDPTDKPMPGRQRAMREIAAVSFGNFNKDSIRVLLTDLEETKAELDKVRKQCADMGDPL